MTLTPTATAMTTQQAMASRLEEIAGITTGMTEEDVQRLAPDLWRERSEIERRLEREAEQAEAIARSRDDREARRRRAAEFPPKLEEFQDAAIPIGVALCKAADSLDVAHREFNALTNNHRTLVREGQAVGARVPPLHEMLGIPAGRLQRIVAAVAYLRAPGSR